MMKKTLKMLSLLASASVLGAGYGYAQATEPEGCCPGATFAARGCETQCVTVGGYISANYQWAQLRDHLHIDRHRHHGHHGRHHNRHEHADHISNFYMKAIRVFVRGELCNGWSGLMSVDFAGRDHTAVHWDPFSRHHGRHGVGSHESHGRSHIFVDRAYIQKEFCNSVLRAGYQKVNFGAEFLVPDECLKTIKRSIATNYFVHLGHKASVGELHSRAGDVRHGGNHFAGRHAGLFYAGDISNFHYHAEIVNSFSGLRHHSTRFSNELGYFAGLAMDYELCGLDLLFGIHAGFQPQGSRKNHIHDSRHNHRGHVWAVNPYLLANWNCLSFLGEFFWGNIESGSLTRRHHKAKPWGLNVEPSYMLSDRWELVARFAYLNTRGNGTSIENAFSAAPEGQTLLGTNDSSRNFVASEVPFNKAAAVAVGFNFFPIQSVKASLFYEYARFKNPFDHDHRGDRNFKRGHVNVNSVAAQLQLVF